MSRIVVTVRQGVVLSVYSDDKDLEVEIVDMDGMQFMDREDFNAFQKNLSDKIDGLVEVM